MSGEKDVRIREQLSPEALRKAAEDAARVRLEAARRALEAERAALDSLAVEVRALLGDHVAGALARAIPPARGAPADLETCARERDAVAAAAATFAVCAGVASALAPDRERAALAQALAPLPSPEAIAERAAAWGRAGRQEIGVAAHIGMILDRLRACAALGLRLTSPQEEHARTLRAFFESPGHDGYDAAIRAARGLGLEGLDERIQARRRQLADTSAAVLAHWGEALDDVRPGLAAALRQLPELLHRGEWTRAAEIMADADALYAERARLRLQQVAAAGRVAGLKGGDVRLEKGPDVFSADLRDAEGHSLLHLVHPASCWGAAAYDLDHFTIRGPSTYTREDCRGHGRLDEIFRQLRAQGVRIDLVPPGSVDPGGREAPRRAGRLPGSETWTADSEDE